MKRAWGKSQYGVSGFARMTTVARDLGAYSAGFYGLGSETTVAMPVEMSIFQGFGCRRESLPSPISTGIQM
jgi:hypothetical protein